MALARDRGDPRLDNKRRVVASMAGYKPSPPLPYPLPSASGVSAPKTKSTETADDPPLLFCRPAAPLLTLYGRGGTNQRATSPFRFEAPDARLTPRAPRTLIGRVRRRSG